MRIFGLVCWERGEGPWTSGDAFLNRNHPPKPHRLSQNAQLLFPGGRAPLYRQVGVCCQEICSDGMASALGPSLCVLQWYFPASHHHCNAVEEPRATTECFLRKLHNHLCSSLGRFAHPVWCLTQLSDQTPVPSRTVSQPWSPSLSGLWGYNHLLPPV